MWNLSLNFAKYPLSCEDFANPDFKGADHRPQPCAINATVQIRRERQYDGQERHLARLLRQLLPLRKESNSCIGFIDGSQ